MKTRIRKKEYNNGKIEYICEKVYFPEMAIVLFISSLVCFIVFLYNLSFSFNSCFAAAISSLTFLFIGLDLFRDRWGLIHNGDTKSIFDDLESAKKIIDYVLKKEADEKVAKDGNKTKKETIIKYP